MMGCGCVLLRVGFGFCVSQFSLFICLTDCWFNIYLIEMESEYPIIYYGAFVPYYLP